MPVAVYQPIQHSHPFSGGQEQMWALGRQSIHHILLASMILCKNPRIMKLVSEHLNTLLSPSAFMSQVSDKWAINGLYACYRPSATWVGLEITCVTQDICRYMLTKHNISKGKRTQVHVWNEGIIWLLHCSDHYKT